MGRRRALAIDRDKRFTGLLARTLRRAGFVLDVVEGRKAGLERLATRPPAIVFIAVERPKKTGFSLFTDVKNVVKNVPVVLASATVPMADMLLHQKLRIHADAYLDKRHTGEIELLDTLNDLFELNMDESELDHLATLASDEVSLPAGDGSGPAEQAREGDGEELGAVLASLGVSQAALDESKPVVEPDEEADLAHDELELLREEVEGLRRDLDVARRAAASSPFATDYLNLSDQVSREKKKSSRLAREVAARADQAEPLRRGLTEAAHRLLEVEARHRQDAERIGQLEESAAATAEELARGQAEIQRLERRVAEETESRRQQDQVNAVSLATLEAEMAGEADAVQKRHRDEMNQLGHAHAEEQQQVTQLRAQVESLGRQHDDAREAGESAQRELADRSQEWNQKQARAAEELDRLRERQTEERRQLQQARISALEELAEKLRRERAEELRAKDSAWQARLDKVEQEHAEAVTTLRKKHEDAVSALNGAHEEQFARRIGELREQLERTAGEREGELTRELHERLAELEQAEAKRRADLSAQEEQYRKESEILTQLHEAQLEEAQTKHERERGRLEREHRAALDTGDAEWRTKTEELERRHELALADERERHQSELAAQEKRLLGKLAEAGAHHREELDRLEKRAGGELGRLRDRHEQERDRLQQARDSALAEQAEQAEQVEQSNRSHAEEVEARESEWQAKLEELRCKSEAVRAAEREELQSVLDALQSSEKRANPVQPAKDVEVDGGLSDGARRLLRQLANELDGTGGGEDAARGDEPGRPTS